MSREQSTYDTVRPYVNRAMRDDDVRRNVLRAWSAARKVYSDLSSEDAIGAVGKLGRDEQVRNNIDTTVQSLSEAIVRMSGRKQKERSHWGLFAAVAVAAFVLFNPATGGSTRKWIKDHLFGSEEEFDYSTPNY